jgi:hypothetical protein
MNLKDLLYSFTCLSFTVIIGAAVYEHLAVVPRWTAAPPASLSMFTGEYGLNAGAFWMPIHPITLLLLIATLISSWKTERRKNVLITLVSYVGILIITAIYFVPELMKITGTPFSDTVDTSLTSRANLWEKLSILRLLMLIVLSTILFLGLTKRGTKSPSGTY